MPAADSSAADSSTADSSIADVTAPDVSRADSGGADGGSRDSGAGDGNADSSAADSGTDSGARDAGTDASVDSGEVDADSDSGVVDSGFATFASVYTTIIVPNCLPCHSPGIGTGFNIGKLDMAQQGATYLNLVGLSGAGVGAIGVGQGSTGTTCNSVAGLLLRVQPGMAVASLLWEGVNARLIGGAMPPCGLPCHQMVRR